MEKITLQSFRHECVNALSQNTTTWPLHLRAFPPHAKSMRKMSVLFFGWQWQTFPLYMQNSMNLIVEKNLTLRKQKSEPTAALQSSVVFALHSDKTEPDLLQSHVKEINVCFMVFAPTLFPYLEMGICSLFLRIRSISAIPHSSCVLMKPSVVWFFFLLFF